MKNIPGKSASLLDGFGLFLAVLKLLPWVFYVIHWMPRILYTCLKASSRRAIWIWQILLVSSSFEQDATFQVLWNKLTWALEVNSSRCWSESTIETSVCSFSQGSCSPGPSGKRTPLLTHSRTRLIASPADNELPALLRLFSTSNSRPLI